MGHSRSFQRVSRLGSVTARHSISGRQLNCGVEQRAPPIFGRATIRLGIGPHSSCLLLLLLGHQHHPRYVSYISICLTLPFCASPFLSNKLLRFSVNLIPVSFSHLLIPALPHLFAMSTHDSHQQPPRSFTPGSKPTSFISLSYHRLTPGLRTDCTDFMTGAFLLSISVFVLSFLLVFFMVALCNRADHIYFHAVSFFLLFYFLA